MFGITSQPDPTSEYHVDYQSHNSFGGHVETSEETPPLTAIIELIGQNCNSNESWKNKNNLQHSCCHVCTLPIQEQYLLRVGTLLCHELCVQCCICREHLTEKCYEKEGYFYCYFHYNSNYSPFQCSGCHLGISPNEMVYKLKTGLIYHVQCHFCYLCGRQLIPGEQIIVDEVTKAVTCLSHNQEAQSSQHSVSSPTKEKAAIEPKKRESKKEKRIFKKESSEFGSSSISTVLINPIIPQYPFEMYAFGEMYSDDGRLMKRRGPRTTIKQNQLDVLNQIFSSTPKPSKHARAKLALETGLSMRVIQVWFQNRRSKERRLKHLCNFLRHYEQQGLPPPPFNINPDDGTVITAAGSFSPQSLQCFGIDDSSFIYDDEAAELSS